MFARILGLASGHELLTSQIKDVCFEHRVAICFEYCIFSLVVQIAENTMMVSEQCFVLTNMFLVFLLAIELVLF